MSKLDTPTTVEEREEAKENASVRKMLKDGKDRFGVEIPEHLLPVFKSKAMTDIYRRVRALRKEIMTRKKEGDLSFKQLGPQALINLENAAANLKYALPYCVCRACRGEGCYRCGRNGFQTRFQYEQLPSEFKATEE